MAKMHPPKWADWFLKWYCNPDLLEELQGDLHELYYVRAGTSGKRYADVRFVWEVLRLVRFPVLKNPSLSAQSVLLLASLKSSGGQSWNDMLFETRNKDYGAYRIRKSYDQSMLWGFMVVVVIATFIVSWWWIEFKP